MSECVTIPAATLIVARDRPGMAPAFLMVRRHAAMSFADAWVFPGGRIDDGDRALAAAMVAAGSLIDADDLAARIAAIRETIEEAGLAVGLEPLPGEAMLAAMRRALRNGADFAGVLAGSGIALRPERLEPFARWSPPAHVNRRFDTRFYLAIVEGDAAVSADGDESVDIGWAGAAEMLARSEAGTVKLVFPTRANLHRLALHASYAALAEAARAIPVRMVETRAEPGDGWIRLTVPEGHGYGTFTHVERLR